MAVKIGHASINEIDRSYGGEPGDQSKEEVYLRNWYNGSWSAVLRHKNPEVAAKMVKACHDICSNEYIGYDSSVAHRNTLYDEALKVNFDFTKITTPCSCDCSSFIQVCAIAAGVNVPYGANAMTTRTMVERLMSTGEFIKYITSDYTRSEELLKSGDILHRVGHTAMVTVGYAVLSHNITAPILKLGDRNDTVETVQRILSTFGYHLGNNNPYDGNFGKLTQAAVTEYQADNGLAVTGIVDEQTWNFLIFNRKEA